MEKSKRTRAIPLFLSAALLLGALGACQHASGPDPSAPSETGLTAKELVELALPYSGCEDPAVVEHLNVDEAGVRLSVYIEEAYGMAGWTDAAIVRATGASAFELTVMHMEDEGSAEGGEERLRDYLHRREGDFTGYAPGQTAMIANGVVWRAGAWLGLFICPSPEEAKAAFDAALSGGSLPEHPAPVPMPEPEVDMLSLMVALIRSCKDEIDALGGYSYMSSEAVAADYFREVAAEYYGVDSAQMGSGFCVTADESSQAFPIRAFELTVLRMISDDEAARNVGGFQRYLQDRETVFTEMELPEEAELAANGLVFQTGRYLALFVCQDPEEVRAEFEDALLRLRPTQSAKPSQSPQKVDMDLLKERLEAVCQEEVAEIRGQNRLVIRATEVSSFSTKFVGINFDRAENGFWFGGAGPEDALQAAVLYMEDERAAAHLANEFQVYLWSQEYNYVREDLPEQAEQMSNGSIVQLGRYAALFVCQDPQEMKAELETALHDLPPEGPSAAPSSQPGTLEQPIFVELDRPEPEGERDPDFPGRIRFARPNKEDMSIYDTSAILAAWSRDDPTGLSDDDRAIYDAAQAVLEEVLHDGMSAFEIEAALYDWVVQNIDYGWSRADVLEEVPREAYTPYGGLIDRMAVCLGYASSFQLLMEMAGMECLTVVGASHGSTVDHAWNMVRLNGQWYCVDATWDCAYREAGQMNGCEWRYFNVTSDYMARTNHQWDFAIVPEATAGDLGKN